MNIANENVRGIDSTELNKFERTRAHKKYLAIRMAKGGRRRSEVRGR